MALTPPKKIETSATKGCEHEWYRKETVDGAFRNKLD